MVGHLEELTTVSYTESADELTNMCLDTLAMDQAAQYHACRVASAMGVVELPFTTTASPVLHCQAVLL